MEPTRILVVDDEPGVRAALEGILGDEGFEVETAASGEEALETLATSGFDAVLLDIWLPGIDGLETLTRLKDRQTDSEVVMISGHGTIETAVRATKLGAFDFIEKPLSLERTLLVLRNALRQRRLERRNQRLLEQLARDTEILGRSAAARRLREEVGAAATSDAPVLVSGERGSGRETVVRRLHSLGRRSAEAFVEVPCAALEAAAAETALFGGGGQPPRAELARRGTLFLQNVDRLETVLQERLAASIGAREFLELDCRLVASTDAPGERLADPLRERLEVVHLRVPPLRARREDVPTLAEHFMTELAREYGVPEKKLTSDCLSALAAYPWPGNVRELRNVVERVLLTVDGGTIDVADLPESLGGARAPAVDLYGSFPTLEDALRAFERHYVERVLADCGGDVPAAAERLAIPPRAVRERIRTLGIR